MGLQGKQTIQCNFTYSLHVIPLNYKRRKKGKGQNPLTNSSEWDANYQNLKPLMFLYKSEY